MNDENQKDPLDLSSGDESQKDSTEPKTASRKGGSKKKGSGKPKEKRRRIKLANNGEIPPGGQFISVNGKGYRLKPGKEANVPVSVLEALDNAVVKRPVMGDDGRVKAWEEGPRFPYQMLD